MNLDAYFERIGYDGRRGATLDVLRELHTRHTHAIAFENLSPYLRLDMALDPASLFSKMVQQRRGGYCYEQNGLFRHALDTLGFRTRGLAARVRFNVPEGQKTARTHMLLMVEIGAERYIADVGFGGMTLTAPIRFVMDLAQETPHGLYRLSQDGGHYTLSAQAQGEWTALYSFNLVEHDTPDYEVMNWYTARHPRSVFTANLVAARPVRDGRHALLNNRYSFYGLSGVKGEQMVTSVAELRDLLVGVFRIEVPDVPDAEEKLALALATT